MKSSRKHNPRIVYCSISGYGQTGPYAEKGAFDVTVQAMSGVMSVTGEESGPPVKCGVPIGDFGAGLYAAFTSLAAIMKAREGGVRPAPRAPMGFTALLTGGPLSSPSTHHSSRRTHFCKGAGLAAEVERQTIREMLQYQPRPGRFGAFWSAKRSALAWRIEALHRRIFTSMLRSVVPLPPSPWRAAWRIPSPPSADLDARPRRVGEDGLPGKGPAAILRIQGTYTGEERSLMT